MGSIVLRSALAIGAAWGGGCVREPTQSVCPAVEPGDLVMTEIRGSQGTPDTYGQWIEIFNTTTESVDLRGLELRMYRLNGAGEINALLREDELLVDGQEYFVIGHHDPARLPAFVDATIFYDYNSSSNGTLQPRSLYPDAVLELVACGTEIDRTFYRDLPQLGTLAFDGAKKPNSVENEDPQCWCNDTNDPDPEGPKTQLGIPGTPGAPNPPCP